VPLSSPESLATHPDRIIALPNAQNFRDLGGYPTARGGQTRWGVLFRADGLQYLADADIALIKDLNIGHVIDLRSRDELKTRGTFPIDKHEVVFSNHAIIDLSWSADETPVTNDAMEFLLWAYPEMLTKGAQRFADALHTIAHAHEPLVFHCAAGKDRTGLLAMMVLGLLGCDHDIIVADYEQSNAAMKRLTMWAEQHSQELADRIGVTPASFMSADGRAMRIIMDGLVAEHGSIRGYVSSLGVNDETLALLEARLIS